MKKKDGQKCKIMESHDSSQQAGQDQKSVKTINADHINSLVKPFRAGKILFNKEVSKWESDDDVMGHRLHAMAGFGCLGAGRVVQPGSQPLIRKVQRRHIFCSRIGGHACL